MKSLGFVEVTGVVAAIDALDIMCKSANVSLVSWERKLGGRLVTLIITGDVSAVTSAIENAKAQCIKRPCASAVIANPHSETLRLAELSAKRLEKDKGGSQSTPEEKPATEESAPTKAPVKEEAPVKEAAVPEAQPSANEAPAIESTERKPAAKKAPARKPSAKRKKRDDEDDVWHESPTGW